MTTETITWHAAVDTIPDADTTVLIQSAHMDPPVWMGYFDGIDWRNIEGFVVRQVTHWTDIPTGVES